MMRHDDAVAVARSGSGEQPLHRLGGVLPHAAADRDGEHIRALQHRGGGCAEESLDWRRRRQEPHRVGDHHEIEMPRRIEFRLVDRRWHAKDGFRHGIEEPPQRPPRERISTSWPQRFPCHLCARGSQLGGEGFGNAGDLARLGIVDHQDALSRERMIGHGSLPAEGPDRRRRPDRLHLVAALGAFRIRFALVERIRRHSPIRPRAF